MGGDIYWLDGGGAVEWAYIQNVPRRGCMTFQAYWLAGLVDQAALALLLESLFLVLSSNLGIVLQNTPALITPLDILAIHTLAILVAGDSCLKALTVFFQAF